jgi:FAD/FMN-containing dehydrogenase
MTTGLLAKLGGVTGRVITPEDAGYDEARQVFYGGFDRRPAAIVGAADATDVSRVISLARESGLELAVRSGAHSLAGHSTTEGGIVLDLSAMRALEIDAGSRTAWAGSGLTAGEYSEAAAVHGLATGFGDTGSVGIGGITVGGGVGYLVRKHGLTIDSLLAADVVTADGQLLHVDETSHPDLFWAIRGGGGNFGVVTRFRFRLHPVGTVVGGMLLLPATPEVIAGFVAEAEAAPEELSAIVNVMPAMPMPMVPEEHHGALSVMALLCYAGDVEAGERAVAPFRALAPALADLVAPMPYPGLFTMFDAPEAEEAPQPLATHRSMFVDSIDLGVAEGIVANLQAHDAMMVAAQLRVLGGAAARVPVDATAFGHRGSRIMVTLAAVYEDVEETSRHEAWVSRFADALRQDDPGVYVNFLGHEGDAAVRSAYPGATWDRLAAIKARYDPTNLFRLNQNIPPASP